jgi:hypothetical protein
LPTNFSPPAEGFALPAYLVISLTPFGANMDVEDTNAMASNDNEERRVKDLQVDNAIRAIQQKKPLPEIDFTIHTMEDGTQVSTLERVCKGTPPQHAATRCWVPEHIE